ncbi:MAG: hypothetical protein DRJ14_07635 [Acidobacteria bacterium]|nr:MAG: hypothetical protein DRJ14_07635 [Acidobacteriota bacterium]
MNTKIRSDIEKIRYALLSHYGPLFWWPGNSPDEIAIGAILTQNTAWKNVEKAINNMKKATLLSFPAILQCDTTILAEAVRPSGYFNQKAKKLKILAKKVCQNGGKTITDFLKGKSTAAARKQLLDIWGIGRETADSILLYADNRRIFVVDAYTKRIFSRHGISAPDADYEIIRKMVENAVPADPAAYNEFHAGIVNLGKDFCHKQSPNCGACPLKALNPLPGQLT